MAIRPCCFLGPMGGRRTTGLLLASQELTDFDSAQNCRVAGPCRRTMLSGLPAGPAAFWGWEGGPGPRNTSRERVVLLGSTG